ncbi:hypothetical protein [Gemella morbillorum]|uniref:hypothetical protein n=1 Tax=Gemella morbillorum TaxID=29391 RepID=UPI00248D4FD4|nr:hypothetical protein [Gemella morbillorum]
MKLRKLLLPLAVAGTMYYVYKKSEEQELNNEHIDRCRNSLIAEGYTVQDSYTLNLIENQYLMFYFSDEEKDYEVRFDKETDTIEYIKEV